MSPYRRASWMHSVFPSPAGWLLAGGVMLSVLLLSGVMWLMR